MGAFIIGYTVHWLKSDYNLLIYKIGFPVMAVGWLIVLAFGSVNGAALSVHAIGFRITDLAIWSVTIYIIKQQE